MEWVRTLDAPRQDVGRRCDTGSIAAAVRALAANAETMKANIKSDVYLGGRARAHGVNLRLWRARWQRVPSREPAGPEFIFGLAKALRLDACSTCDSERGTGFWPGLN